jgi:F-type H+-transporting ATPase subunit gamma
MANLRALVRRRKAIRNIRKITKTMELIATSRFKRAMVRATEAEAFTRKIAEVTADLAKNAGEVSHPLLAVRPQVKKALLLVITSNRGLCGGYNGGIIRDAMATVRQLRTDNVPFDLEVSGKRGIAYMRFQGIHRAKEYTQFEDKPTFAQVDELAGRYIDLYLAGQVDKVVVVYQKFLNAARQEPTAETLLPLSSVSVEPTRKAKAGEAEKPANGGPRVEYEFYPSAAEILGELVPVAFKVRLFKCFLDAAVSEQIARRVAMKAATENAGDLIKSVTRVYNRTRQANITREISELIGGAEALR